MSDEKIVEKPFSPGLAGVVGAETAVGYVDGAAGRLLYRGYPIEEVVTQEATRAFLICSSLVNGTRPPNSFQRRFHQRCSRRFDCSPPMPIPWTRCAPPSLCGGG